METIEHQVIPPAILADLAYAAQLAAEGKKEPTFANRVHAEAEKIRESIFRKYGLLDIGVPAIRALRNQD